ncbi:MAG: hypothetical protein HKO10_08240 [Acidimicrobiia bacterium]|nr:hypothetical protein [Acidimicrobiia bacterium]
MHRSPMGNRLGNKRGFWPAFLSATVVVVSACSGTGADPLVPTPATEASLPAQDVPTTALEPEVDADPVEPAEPVDTAPQDPEIGADVGEPPPGSFVVLAEEVVPLVDQVVPRLDRPSGLAFADGAGGLVFQPPWGVDDVVFYLGPESSGPGPLLDVEGGRLLRLWGATNTGETPRLLATVIDNADTAEQIETLLWWDRVDKERWIAQVGDASTRVDHVDYGQDRYVVDKTTPEGSSFVFLDAGGEIVEIASNPKPLCREVGACRRLPTLAPGNGRMAYHDPARSQIVVVELDLAEEVAFDLPEGTEVTSLDLSDQFLVVNHTVGGEPGPAFVVDLDAARPSLSQLADPGEVFLGVLGSR